MPVTILGQPGLHVHRPAKLPTKVWYKCAIARASHLKKPCYHKDALLLSKPVHVEYQFAQVCVNVFIMGRNTIGHFWVTKCRCFKTGLGARPFIWTWVWFAGIFPIGENHEWFRMKIRFATEAKVNSERAYFVFRLLRAFFLQVSIKQVKATLRYYSNISFTKLFTAIMQTVCSYKLSRSPRLSLAV